MSEVKSLEQLTLVAAFVVPGLIAMFVRAQFLTGRLELKDSLLAFFTLSLVWYGISVPFVASFGDQGISPYQRPGSWLLWIVLGPAAFGSLLGINASKGWSRWILARIGVHLVHEVPTAWDKTFAGLTACWVLVTLKDGSKVAGWCGTGSFASSDPKERDLYIERMYGLDEHDAWQEIPARGVLIPGGEIRCIELFRE